MRKGVLLGFLFLLKFIGCLAEDNWPEDNHVDRYLQPVPTRLSLAEKTCLTVWKFIQWIINMNEDNSRKMERFIFDLPEAIRDLITHLQETIMILSPGDLWDEFSRLIHGIFPSTRWCGAGNMASGSNELGHCKRTDSCCRAHDHCKISIEAGRVRHNLKNIGLFTRSLCQCDRAFHKCLKHVDSVVSSMVGWTYFNVLSPQCFKKEHPIIRCKHEESIATTTVCTKYKLNKRKKKIWQWFDNPLF